MSNYTCTDYTSAADVLAGGRDPDRRTVKNNTVLYRISETQIGLRLHETTIVVYDADGTITLDSGGWRSVTTKSRLSEYTPISISQDRGVWYCSSRNPDYVSGSWNPEEMQYTGQVGSYWNSRQGFADGCSWNANTGEWSGVVSAEELAERKRENDAMRRRISKFCRSITAEAVAIAMAPPNPMGSCFTCQALHTSCLETHIDQNHVHAALIRNAGALYYASDDPERVILGELRRKVGSHLRANLLTGVATR